MALRPTTLDAADADAPARAAGSRQRGPAGSWLRWPGPSVWIVLTVAGGVALRLWSPYPLWLDEAQTVAIARLPIADIPAALETDGAPPLYYLLLHWWMSVFGDGVGGARSLSMVCSLAALPLAYHLGGRFGGDRTHAVVTLLVFAANPWSVRYAGEARMYSLLALLVMVGLLAGDRLRRRPGPGPTLAVAAVTAALLLTHYWSIFLLAVVGVTVLYAARRHPRHRPAAKRAVLAMAAGGVAFLPWVPIFVFQVTHTGSPWAAPPDLAALAALPLEWSGGGGPAGATMATAILPLMLLAVFARRAPAQPDGSRASIVLGVRAWSTTTVLGAVTAATLLLALAVSMLVGGAVIGRYTAVVVPFVLLLVAFGLCVLPGPVRAGVLATLVVLGLLGGLTIARTPHTQAGEIAAVLDSRADGDDLLLYCPDQLAPAVEELLDDTGPMRWTIPSQPNPRVIDWVDYTERVDEVSLTRVVDQVADYLAETDGATLWLVAGFGYRTHKDVCEPLRGRLTGRLGYPVEVYDGYEERGHEKASLYRFS